MEKSLNMNMLNIAIALRKIANLVDDEVFEKIRPYSEEIESEVLHMNNAYINAVEVLSEKDRLG